MIPFLRLDVHLAMSLGVCCLLGACSGGGGSSTTSTPPADTTSPAPPSTSTPPAAGLLGTWAGVWSSSLSTAGGAMAMRIDLDTPQGPVLMQSAPCGLHSKLIAQMNGSVLSGLLAYPGPNSFDVPVMATLSRTGEALIGSYATGGSPRAGCGNDRGQWTLIRTPDRAVIEVALPIQAGLGALLTVPLAYTGSEGFDRNIPGNLPLSVTFPTVSTLLAQTSSSRTEARWLCEGAGRACDLAVTQATYVRKDPIVHYLCDWHVTALPIAVGGGGVKGSITLACGNMYGSLSQSAVVGLAVRLTSEGVLILGHPITGAEVTTGVNVFSTTIIGGVL